MSTTLATAAAEKQNERGPTARSLIIAQTPAIEAQLAGAMNSGAFVRAALNTVMRSEELQRAEPSTLLGAIMLAAQLKLEIGPGLGYFYLTPRMDRGQMTCLPIIGYQGYIELAYRSGRIEKVETFLVRDGDVFNQGADSERGRYFDWRPRDYEERREVTGVVALAKVFGAGTVWTYLPLEKVLARRPSYWRSTPWSSDTEAMYRKTGVRALAPYLPKSTELGRALETDEQRVVSVPGEDLHVTRITEDEHRAPEPPPAVAARRPERQKAERAPEPEAPPEPEFYDAPVDDYEPGEVPPPAPPAP